MKKERRKYLYQAIKYFGIENNRIMYKPRNYRGNSYPFSIRDLTHPSFQDYFIMQLACISQEYSYHNAGSYINKDETTEEISISYNNTLMFSAFMLGCMSEFRLRNYEKRIIKIFKGYNNKCTIDNLKTIYIKVNNGNKKSS